MPSILLLDFDLTKTLKAENLQIPSSPVKVTIDVDKNLHKLMQDDPLIHQQLADAGIEVLQENRAWVKQQLQVLDARIKVAETPKELENASKELRRICAKLAAQAQKDARQAIENRWKSIQSRQSALKTYKIKIGVKLAVNAISILAGVGGLVLSLGTTWMTIAGMAKSLTDMVWMVAELADSAEEAHQHLHTGMEELTDRYQQAFTKWKQAGEAAHEVWDTINPLGKLIGTSLGSVEGRSKVYEAKLQALENKSSDLTKKILKLLIEIKKAEPKARSKKKKEASLLKMKEQSEQLFKNVQDLQTGLKKSWKYCDWAKETIALYKNKRNQVLRHSKLVSELTATAVALTFIGKGLASVAQAL